MKRLLHRRRFLGMLAGLGVFAFLGPRFGFEQGSTAANVECLPVKLADFFTHRESARAVGRAYLHAMPTEADADRLAELICMAAPADRATLARASRRELRSLLQARQRQDFAEGRTIEVQGWLLSQTEARLCAIAALV
ncbi:MAG: hypothetical protein ACOY4L_07695 [Pseudomonadota bacterium]